MRRLLRLKTVQRHTWHPQQPLRSLLRPLQRLLLRAPHAHVFEPVVLVLRLGRRSSVWVRKTRFLYQRFHLHLSSTWTRQRPVWVFKGWLYPKSFRRYLPRTTKYLTLYGFHSITLLFYLSFLRLPSVHPAYPLNFYTSIICIWSPVASVSFILPPSFFSVVFRSLVESVHPRPRFTILHLYLSYFHLFAPNVVTRHKDD